ncbi:MAG: threonine--tRNA ligase [Bdellovibrionales bacterium GWA1_52_35]|nr:MAG: threonine--tRNA ligase [Bdellovibrionales bacterium GWA1_52_35]HCM40040.1 threonine--tRNA ligase [Bdellovibrionales bacterium]
MNKEDPAIHSEVETLRHSCAHVMAHAIQKIWPNAKFGIGPTIESGFYYDIDIDTKLSPEDLPRIEAEMFKLINANQGFVRKEHSLDEAIEIFRKLGQTYKIELIEDLRKVGVQSVSTYGEGDFLDLCRGPHLQKTGQIKAFKLTSVAGAYWRGSEKNPQLQRIYGTAYPSKAELHEHMRLIEEAKKRDHRKLGKELDLFSFHPEAPASPFFHPKGTVVYNRLVQLMRDLYRPYQYDEIITPQIMDISLWKKSGHYDNYREDMFFTESEERQFAIKPMNCPAATFVYSSHKRSYRDLPLRLADFGRVHRNEKSGVTAGLTRVRTFCQDDAHIFCTPEQIETEIKKVIEMSMKIYKLFDFTDIRIALSTRPEKRVGGDELWDQAEVALKKVLDNTGHAYEVNPGDGAFYGPKIDFRVKDALKREHQLSTIQLDFNLPERFDLTYVGTDNSSNRPVMVHRAVLGSIERFMGVLVEHVAGAFPFWLAPLQARIVPIGDGHTEYCKGLMTELQELGYRVDLDARNESMGLKTRESQTAKIPFMAVAGDREMQDGQFAIRKYGERESKVLGRAELLAFFKELNEVPHQLTRS